jgi:peptidoglycan/LPS O-acetylase OafA/YrhL
MNDTHDTTAESPSDERALDPREVAVLLDPREAAVLMAETKKKAVIGLELNSIVLCLLGALTLPLGFGILWWSVRHQHPYQGPTVDAIGLFYVLIPVIDIAALTTLRRASRGVGGLYKRNRRLLGAMGAVGLVGTFTIMGALEHAHVSNVVVYGIYLATMPLLVGGLIGAVGAIQREDWTMFIAALGVSGVAAGAAFGGPAGAWAISGFGSGAVLLACALVKLSQRHAR